jgi:hypothetical protein
MSIPRNLGAFADNVTSTGTLNVTGINATGTPSSTTVLAGNGSWVTPSAGAMTLISTQTASNSASLEWTGLSGKNNYILMLNCIRPVTNATQLYLQFGTGSTTYVTSGYYYGFQGELSSATYTDNGFANASGIAPFNNYNTVANNGTSAIYNIYNMNNSQDTYLNGLWTLAINTSPVYFSGYIGGALTGNTTIKTAIRLILSSGNISSGTASLYSIST